MTPNDVVQHRADGKLCILSHGVEMIWNGHLCEGANLTPIICENFCLWTRCGRHDVPADRAHEGDIGEVTCDACRDIWNEENGRFGAGA